MFIPIYSMILLGLFLVFYLYALKILQKNNDDTRRQIAQLRKDIELILEKIRENN